MTELVPITAAFDARVEPCSLARRYAIVDPAFAARLRSEHARRFEVAAIKTDFGAEQLTRDVPNVGEDGLVHLDEQGLARPGTAVEPGMILVGKETPTGDSAPSPEEKLLRAIFGEKAGETRDTSLRVPPGCFGVVTEARLEPAAGDEPARASVEVAWERPLDVGDLLLVGGEPVIVADIRPQGADLAWSGGRSTAAVAKAAMARDVLHARSIGPYSLLTQQPTRDRERFGGQPLEPEQVEVLAARAPWALWEMLTLKADAVGARTRACEAIVRRDNPAVVLSRPGAPASAAGGPRDIFSFFEVPAAPAPDEVLALPPESVTSLEALLRAMGLRLSLHAAEIGAALLGPEQILEGSHGEVRLPETADVRTHAPVPGGLLCEKIFGPVKDYQCACGKYRRMKHRGVVCEECGVEVIQSKVRRERFGHIALPSPCLHPLLVAEVATLLELSEPDVREVLAGRAVLQPTGDLSWRVEPGESVEGGQALWDALARLDLEAIDAIEAGPRADLASTLLRAELPATALMLRVVPVLPPDLRLPTDDEHGSSSTLTHLYRVIVNRCSRLVRLRELNAPVPIIANEHAQLQLALDHLVINGRLESPATGPDGEPVPSLGDLADTLFSSRIFTKTVDYSGVAHVVADPSLPEGECRLPHAMRLELFKPFAYGILEARGHATTIKSAKRMIERGSPEGLAAIEEASEGYPVLLMAGAAVVSRRVRGWDAPAIAVDPATARRLDAIVATVHVPVTHQAALQCASLDDLPAPQPIHGEGWLCRARHGGRIVATACVAALHGDRDPVGDPIVAMALGRPPAEIDEDELARWAERERERQERIWERVRPVREALADATDRNPALARRVDELELSVATYAALDRAEIQTIAELCRRTDAELLKLRGLGRKQLREIKQILADLGLSLGMHDA